MYWHSVGIRWGLNRDYIGRTWGYTTPIVESPMEQKDSEKNRHWDYVVAHFRGLSRFL